MRFQMPRRLLILCVFLFAIATLSIVAGRAFHGTISKSSPAQAFSPSRASLSSKSASTGFRTLFSWAAAAGVTTGSFFVPAVTATKSATLGTDVNTNTFVNPGDTLMYSVVVANAGNDLLNVIFTDTLDPNLTLVGSAIASPIATNDAYAVIGNVGITVPLGGGLRANDVNPQGTGTMSASAGAASAQGGNVSVAADGSFTYMPPVGFEGTDTFVYTLTHSNGKSDTGTVTLSVNEVIWFVDNSQGTNGNGRLGTAFNSLPNFVSGAADDTGDIIFLYRQDASNYVGPLTLLNNQILIGQGATASIATIASLALPPFSNPLPATGGTRPIVRVSNNSGVNNLTLGTGNIIRGFNLETNATGANTTGTALIGNNFGNLTASEISIASTTNQPPNCGGAVRLTTGNPTASFTSISADGCTNGIALSSTTGSFTVAGTGAANSGGTIQNSTDDGIIGTTVSNFSLTEVNVTNNGNSGTDEGIELDNLTGTCSLTNVDVTSSSHNNFDLDNTSGTLTSLTITGGSFNSNDLATGNHGFAFQARGTAVVASVSISNATFSNNVSMGLQALTADTATVNSFIVSGCTFSDTGTGNSQEIGGDFSTSQASNLTFKLLNSTLTGHNSHAMNAFTAAGSTGGTLNGTIEGNTIGNQAVIDSGSKIGNGMRLNINGNANARIKVNNNTLRQIPTGRGIEAISRNGTGGASFIITNNTINAPTGTATGCGGLLCPLAPIYVASNAVAIPNTACSVVSGNTAFDPLTFPGGGEFSAYLRELGGSTHTYEGTGANALASLTAANPGCVTKSVDAGVSQVSPGTCATPPPAAPPIEAEGQGQNAVLDTPGTGRTSSTLLGRARQFVVPVFSAFAAPTNYLIADKLRSWLIPTVSAAELRSSETPVVPGAEAPAKPSRTMLIDSRGEYTIVPTAMLAGETITIGAFTLPMGESTTIMFNAQISSSFTGTSIANQATVMAAGPITVMSNNLITEVFQPVTIAKAFNPGSIVTGNSSSLTLTLTNPNAVNQTGASFTDTLVNMSAVGGGVTGTCVGTAPNTLAANATALSFSGITVPASTSCTVIFAVKSSTLGTNPNTTSAVATTQAPTGGVASNTANLLVFATPTIAKAFDPALIPSGGTSTVTLTLSNTNATALTGASFTDTLTNMTALGGAVTGTCVGTTPNTLAANATALSFSGITIPASDSCTVIFDVTSTHPGANANTTSGVTTTQTTPTAGPASNTAVLTVPDAPKLGKAFAGSQATNFIYALSTTNTLTGFNPSTPGTPGVTVTITGLVAGDTVGAIDFRPANGELYGLGVNGTTAHLYTINTTTGAATQVGGNITVSGTNFGFDFNPVADRIRVVSESAINLRLNPNDGTVTTDALLNPGSPDVVGVAYSSNFAGALSTSLFGIDSTTDTLVQHNPPNNGTLVLIGALGVNASVEVGFDIANDPTGTAYASLQVGGVSGLYTINVGTGAATLVGTFGGGITARDIAVVSTAQITFGATATLTFTVTNPNSAISLNNISFSDVFPSGLQVDAIPMATNTCGGAFNPMPGDMTVSLSGGVLASSTSCNLSVKVRATTAGVKINTTGPISSTESGTGGTATASLNVTKASTTLTSITDSPDPSVTGQPYTVGFTLNVTAPGMGTPTGTVTVTDGTGGMCIATLPAVSCPLTSTSMGVKTLTITYSGDPNFNGSNTTAGHQVNKANTTTAVASSQNPSVFGQPVTFTATVAAVSPGSGTPTGNATFIIDGGVVITIPLVGGQAMQASTALTVAGSPHSVVVDYSGDPNYNTSSGALAGGQAVNKANTTTTIVSDNPDSSSVGQNVTVGFTVVATAPGAGTPTGNVTVTVSGGVETCTGSVGAGSCVLALTTPGARTLTATYASDTNFNGGNDTEPHTVVAPPSITKAFTPPTTPVNGTSTLTFTITNPATNTVALTGVGFTDTFPAGLVVANPLTTNNTCGGTLQDNAGGALANGDLGIRLVGGTVNTGSSCVVSVNVTPTVAGPFVNVTGNVISTNGGAGNTATATLLTNTPPTISSNTITVKAGSNAASFTIATAADPDQPVNTLGITINGNPTTASSNGVTVSAVTITPGGAVTANVATTCAATSATFNLVVTDNESATGTGILTVTVTPNMPPMLAYLNQTVTAGTLPSFLPSVGPSDNGTIISILLQSIVPNTGGLILAVNPVTGQVMVTGATLIGSYTVTIVATDNCGATNPATLTVNVICPTITLSPASLPNATVNTAYPQTITASPAGGNYTFAVTSGSLPAGLTLNTNGSFSGAPTQSGTFNFRVTASGFGGCTGFRDYSLTVVCPTITVNPASLPGGTVGTAYSQSVSASPAGSYSYSVSSGSLPSGLTLNTSTGALMGTPTSPGVFNFTITAAAGTCSGSRSYSVAIVCPTIAISPASLPSGQAGIAYSQTLTTTPAGTYTLTIVQGNLPTGLTLIPATGVISGLPAVPGTYTFIVKAATANGCYGTMAYSLVVECPTVLVSPSVSLPGGTKNVFYSQQFSATPSFSYTFARTSGTLPTGLTLNSASGILSGYPTANGTFNFRITASGFGVCSGFRDYTIVIGAGGGCPTITLSATLPNGNVGSAYNSVVMASPAGAYSYAVTSGSLPPGLTLYGSFGLIFGYPTTSGMYNFTITATDSSSCTASKAYTVNIGVSGSILTTGAAGLAVVSAASYRPDTTTPGGIMAAFGDGLAVTTEPAAAIPLPTELGGTRVVIKDAAGSEFAAPIFFVSPQQVNFQIPDSASPGQALLTVLSADGSISEQTVIIVPVAPGLFSANADGVGAPAGFFVHVAGDQSQVLESTAVVDSLSGLNVPASVTFGSSAEQLFLVLHGTGFRGRSGVDSVMVRVGGVTGEVTYAGAQAGYVGLDQINVRLPRDLIGRGEVDVEVIIDGRIANTLRIHVQ